MNFYDLKPPEQPVVYRPEPLDEEEDRKWRWKVRRLAYGGTGCSASCTDKCTPYFIGLCRQRGLRMRDVIRYLRSVGV